MQFWKRPSTILGIALAVGILVFRGVTQFNQAKDALASGVTAATFVVLCWYTWETQKLRKSAEGQIDLALRQLEESQRQTENANRPIIVMEFTSIRYGADHKTELVFRNIGSAPAFNITMSVCFQKNATLSAERVAAVANGDFRHVHMLITSLENGRVERHTNESAIIELLGRYDLTEHMPFTITYERSDKVRYETQTTMSYPANPNWFAFTSYRKVDQ